MKMAGKGADNQ